MDNIARRLIEDFDLILRSTVDPYTITNALFQQRACNPKLSRTILAQTREGSSREEIWNALLPNIPRLCTFSSFWLALCSSGYDILARQLWRKLRYYITPTGLVTEVCRTEVKQHSYLFRLKEIFIYQAIKHHSDLLWNTLKCHRIDYENAHGALKLRFADHYADCLCVAIDLMAMKPITQYHTHKELFDSLKALITETSNTCLTEFAYYSRLAIAHGYANEMETGHGCMVQAHVAAFQFEQSTQYMWNANCFNIRFLCIKAKSPTSAEVDAVLNATNSVLGTLADEYQNEKIVSWKNMVMLRVIYFLLGINHIGKINEPYMYRVEKKHIANSKIFLAEIAANWNALNHIERLIFFVCRVRILELELKDINEGEKLQKEHAILGLEIAFDQLNGIIAAHSECICAESQLVATYSNKLLKVIGVFKRRDRDQVVQTDQVEKRIQLSPRTVQSKSNRCDGKAGVVPFLELACNDKRGIVKFAEPDQDGYGSDLWSFEAIFQRKEPVLEQFCLEIPLSLLKCTSGKMKYREALLHPSSSIESIYMAEVGESLKRKYSELKPAVVPGYQKEANGTSARVFIVYSPDVMHATNQKMEGIGLVMIRNPYRVDDEAMTVYNSKEVDGDISKQDMERAKKAIELHGQTLWCHHSNLNIISVCSVRSKLKGAKLEKCLCVVLYCSTKGVVPLGEREFPTRLTLGENDSIDIDVREGYFEYGGYETRASMYHHDELKMGCNIGALTSQVRNGGGTLGPFVQYNGTMSFLTCAHVLFDITQQHNVNFTYNGFNRLDVVQPATDASSPSGDSCGFVQRAIFNPNLDTSIDVAVVAISDETRRPIKGRFANDHSYKYREAGFDELPEYNNGAVLLDINSLGTSNMVAKFGSETHLTKGNLRMDGAQARPLSTALGLPSMAGKLCMKNQYEVRGDISGIPFFQPGDSGSAVFMLEGTSLHCIGLAIGRTSHYTAVVTPIQAILAAFGSDAYIEMQRFDKE